MEAYFGLGSNLGDRRANLEAGIKSLEACGLQTLKISPVVESPALLPSNAQPEWNTPYLNLAIKAKVSGSPTQWLTHIRTIEDALGRERDARWAPRPLDIDILLWGEQILVQADLQLPHPHLPERSFVITPLLHLAPNLVIPQGPPQCAPQYSRDAHRNAVGATIFELSRTTKPIPLWMAIINLTPDSFSDGGRYPDLELLQREVRSLIDVGAHFLDLGAESTSPRAEPISAGEEWSRLQPGLDTVLALTAESTLPPQVSVDTRHAEVAARALARGVDVINDVSGLASPEMRAVARDSDADWVVMHHLGLPTRPDQTIAKGDDPVDVVLAWLTTRIERWADEGIDPARLLFDPGIGFGKDSLQSLTLLQNVERLRDAGLRLLIGHSRKSFMRFASADFQDRDIETMGISLHLCQAGVDVLRVHDVPGHLRAYRAWSHVEGFNHG